MVYELMPLAEPESPHPAPPQEIRISRWPAARRDCPSKETAGPPILGLWSAQMLFISLLSHVWLCDPVDCRLPGSSAHGALQARRLEWVIVSLSRGSSQTRDQSRVSCISCSGGQVLHCWAAGEAPVKPSVQFSSVQFSRSVVSSSLQSQGLQPARPPCQLPTPGVYSNSCLSWWCHPTIWSSVVPFSSCPQSFPASGSFQMSQLFASGGQSIGVSASASVLPMNIQDWFPLGWTGWISL